MSIVNRIKRLCGRKNNTLIGLEREVCLGRGTIRNWDKNSPSGDKLQKVADYFNVSTDYLLGISASAIIEDRLEELGMTFEEAVTKAKGVSIYWLKNLETFIPGQLGVFSIRLYLDSGSSALTGVGVQVTSTAPSL